MNQLPHRSFATALVRIGAVGDVAVEIFRDRDLGRQRAPRLRHLDVFLLENDLPAVVRDLSGAAFPFDLVEWGDLCIAKHSLETQAAPLCFHARAYDKVAARSVLRFLPVRVATSDLSWIMRIRHSG